MCVDVQMGHGQGHNITVWRKCPFQQIHGPRPYSSSWRLLASVYFCRAWKVWFDSVIDGLMWSVQFYLWNWTSQRCCWAAGDTWQVQLPICHYSLSVQHIFMNLKNCKNWCLCSWLWWFLNIVLDLSPTPSIRAHPLQPLLQSRMMQLCSKCWCGRM